MNAKNYCINRTVFYVLVTLLCLFWMWFAHRFYQAGGLLSGHIHYAKEFDKGNFVIIHPGIFWINSILRHSLSLSVTASLYYLLSVHVALTFCAIIWVLKLLDSGNTNSYMVIWAAMALMVVAPIGLPFLDSKVYDFTNYNRATFLLRNATHTAVLPYVIIAFGLLTKILKDQLETGGFSKIAAIAAGIALLISGFIKPSFASSIVPAIGLYVILNKGIPWSARFKIACILMPTLFLLAGQFVFHFIYNSLYPVTRISFRPWAIWSENNQYPLLAFILATAFPLVVLFYRRNTLTIPILISWINLGIAIIPYSLFYIGENLPGDHRDFEWGYLQARQIVFLCSAVEWWRWLKDEQSELPHARHRAIYGAGILLVAHAVFGCMRLFMVDMKGIKSIW
jgi:hypothetical protein